MRDIFKSEQALEIIGYVRDEYHDELQFLWERFDNAVFIRKDSNKWYAALLPLTKRKLGLDSDEAVEVLDLRARTDDIVSLVDGKRYFPGFHMNKKYWYTICLDGSVPTDEIFRRIDASYELSKK
ncbi:MAG: MmcQ/YjbR family DNA-binding protein [Methanomassiliicoccaceae archaeon]|nr:MmcQ/YjbR family DNA-binding protein [Methanomassiliicoccaceae archaeon]